MNKEAKPDSQSAPKLKPGPNARNHKIQFFLPGLPGKKVYWVGDHNHWETSRAITYSKKHKGYVFTMPASNFGVYFYKWVVDGQWMLDPANPRTYRNGNLGTNSMFCMPAFHEPFEILEVPNQKKGRIERHEVRGKESKLTREVHIYRPPDFDPDTLYPLLVLQDGGECVELFPLPSLFDNLINKNFCAPFLCLLVSPAIGRRDQDYIFNQTFESFLAKDLFDFIRKKKLPVSPKAYERAVFGFSLGGLVSIRTALNHQNVFGLAGGESSAFWPRDFKIFDEIMVKKPSNTRFYLGCANLDGGEQMTSLMANLLSRLGTLYQSRISVGGHDWYYWKTHMRHSLQYFFPPKN